MIKLPKHARRILFVAVTANLAALASYKYSNFGIEIIAPHPLPPVPGTLPLGISLFTFAQVSYLADVVMAARTNRASSDMSSS